MRMKILPLMLLVIASAAIAADNTLGISRITPSGEEATELRQIVIQFDKPVVPLGRMERSSSEIPITITPKLNCQWRWVDRSALACQLDDKGKMALATKYTVTIHRGIKTEDGATIAGPVTHTFTTQLPVVTYSHIRTWRTPGSPSIRVVFNQPVSRQSVQDSMFIEAPGGKSVPVTAEKDIYDHVNARFIRPPGEPFFLDFGPQQGESSESEEGDYEGEDAAPAPAATPAKPATPAKEIKGEEARLAWMVTPVKELEPDTHVYLKVKPGLVSAHGPQHGTENRVVGQFDIFPEFSFEGVQCYGPNDEAITIYPGQGSGPSEQCNPLAPVSLAFSSPVSRDTVKDGVKFTPDLAGGKKDVDVWGESYGQSSLEIHHERGRKYTVTLPFPLKSRKTYSVKGTLKDLFGRPLTEPLEAAFTIGPRKPDMKLVHNEAVLEQGVDSDIPLYITNVDEVRVSYTKLTAKGREGGLQRVIKPSKVKDLAFAIPLESRKMLDGESGVMYGRVDTRPATRNSEYERIFFTQVTPFQVLVKKGHFNTLVWVTDMKTGKAVEGAAVSVYLDTYTGLRWDAKTIAQSTTGPGGVAILPGYSEYDAQGAYTNVWGDWGALRHFVQVRKGNSLGFAPLDHNFQIDSYRISGSVYPSTRRKLGHMNAWGATAQGIYKAGDKIEYKIYVRNQDLNTLTTPPKEKYFLTVYDPMGNKAHEVKGITLSEFGAFHGEFTTAKTAPVGWYRFDLRAEVAGAPKSQASDEYEDEYGGGNLRWTPLTVLVTDFTPSPFKVEASVNGAVFRAGDEMEALTKATLHSGGPYTGASARLTAMFQETSFSSPNPMTSGFYFRAGTGQGAGQFYQETLPMDDKGELTKKIKLDNVKINYGVITVESSVADERGKNVAATATAAYRGVDRMVGLKNSRWLYKKDEPSEIMTLVVDEKGEPAPGTKTHVTVQRREIKSSRVKGAGNAYLTQNVESWVDESACDKVSAKGPVACGFTPKGAGYYKFTASIKDTKGRDHSSEVYAYVLGKGYVAWMTPDDNSLQITPEKNEYAIGATARYLVQNPYPGALALVTVERYGVMDQWVMPMPDSTAVVEFPVKPDYLPGYYLSVAVVSPRVEKPGELGELDLGKPTFRMGYVTVPVRDEHKMVDTKVETAKKEYRPGDTVTVTLNSKPRNPGAKTEPVELAVAVLDEAVLDLLAGGTAKYDPYGGFYHLDGLDVLNFSTLTRLIGRQKLEKKGANAGGDGGGALAMRSLFKFVAYWNPSLPVDKDGKAQVTFKVPDNLTGWRVLAMAVTPTDRMGLGQGSFKVNRPTEARPVMPNQVTEGDTFKAGFSVMNRTEKERTLKVKIKAEGDIASSGWFSRGNISETSVKVGPFKREIVWMDVTTKGVSQTADRPQGQVKFTVEAGDSFDRDGLIHLVPVNKRRSLMVAANYGSTTEETVEESVLLPAKIYPDAGSVGVVLSPSVVGNVAGAFRYVRDYPYICWEQKMTKGVMASHFTALKSYLPDSLKWEEAAGLPQFTLDLAANYQAPNGGMTFYNGRDEYVSQYLSAFTGIAFNWMRRDGHTVPAAVEERLTGYLLNMLRNDVFPDWYTDGMSSSTRAVALLALAERGAVKPDDIRRYVPHVPQMDIFGKAHFMKATLAFKETAPLAADVAKQILGHVNQTGGKFILSETFTDGYYRIMSSPLRSNCAALSAFSAWAMKEEGKKALGDVPFKMVRFITQSRGAKDHFENTQENIFCMNALIEYSKAYESVKPDMTISASFDAKDLGKARFRDVRDIPVELSAPMEKAYAGKKTSVKIAKKGAGRYYYCAVAKYAPTEEIATRQNAGIDIRKEYSVKVDGKWTLLDPKKGIKRGDLVRVDIFVSLPTTRNFVVVDDPVPGGLEPVNTDLATTSAVDAAEGKYQASGGSWFFKFSDWYFYNASFWSFYHKELRHDSARFYSEYLPPGNYHLSYMAQAVATGSFAAMPARAEEMYDPDVFGMDVPMELKVGEK